MTGIRGSGRSGMIRGLAVVLAALPLAGQAASMGTWETTLLGRDLTGDGLDDAYYDTVLNITWLANANLAASRTFEVTGISTAGRMSWATANAWIDEMNTEAYLGYDGWRLPTLSPVNGTSFQTTFSSNGTTDVGTAETTTDGTDGGWRDGDGNPASEMGHMYYVNLGNTAGTGGFSNAGPFTNLQSFFYWSGKDDATNAWRLDFRDGGQDTNDQGRLFFAWAVLDGDVTPVPLPAAGWLFLSALAGLGGVAWRRKQAAAPLAAS